MYLLTEADCNLGLPEVVPILGRLLTEPLRAIERIGGGRNSQVFRVIGAGGEVYAAKYYFRHPLDNRDRLGVEFESLKFLWENGITCVPRPVVADREAGYAIYSYCHGQAIPPASATPGDIDRAADFLAALKSLTALQRSQTLPPASEACFSGEDILVTIHQRLDALSAVAADELAAFLDEQFRPGLERLATRAAFMLARGGRSLGYALEPHEKTLSPSDFGFHNAIRSDNGALMFVDFEYFGWDDPAKTISDFWLHPAMFLDEALRQRFLYRMLAHFGTCGPLAERVRALQPLFALKWCMILLNEFLPHSARRRMFAAASSASLAEAREQQLAKARSMLLVALEATD